MSKKITLLYSVTCLWMAVTLAASFGVVLQAVTSLSTNFIASIGYILGVLTGACLPFSLVFTLDNYFKNKRKKIAFQ